MLAILFHALPLGSSPAWRVNLLSATLAAAAAGLHFLAALRWDLWLAFQPDLARAALKERRRRRAAAGAARWAFRGDTTRGVR